LVRLPPALGSRLTEITDLLILIEVFQGSDYRSYFSRRLQRELDRQETLRIGDKEPNSQGPDWETLRPRLVTGPTPHEPMMSLNDTGPYKGEVFSRFNRTPDFGESKHEATGNLSERGLIHI